MLINYYGTNKTFQHIDFWEILDDSTFKTKDELEFGVDINVWDDTLTADPNTPSLKQMFKDKIVLIGSTMPEDQDLRAISLEDPGMAQESFWDLLLKFKNPFQAKRTSSATAGSNMLYGVELHANAIQNIISGNYVYRLSKSLEVLLAVLLTFISFYLASILRKSKSKYSGLLEIGNILFLLALFLVFRYLSFYAFNNHSILVSIVSPNMAMILGYFGNTAYHFITERKQKGMIKGMFGQYVNVAIVDQLIAHPDRMQLGGERRNLSIFFSDIAGFSTFSEQKEPEDLVTFLNEYLSTMTQVVFDNHGTLDKYIGDAVMAFWNAPLPVENHAYCACKTALEMRKKLFVLREKWKKEGRPLVYARMGINTGDVVVGNVGGSQRFDYTVMGDNVNIASRLEGANKEYGTYIMITENTYEAVKNDFITRELDLMTVKGRTIPMKVYELIAFANDTIPQEQRECIERFEAGLVLFRSAKFEDAKALFQTNVERNDDYTSKMYIKRCDHFIANPPPPDWDGVFHMTTK
jgi:adenylate cyclase